MPGTYNTTQKNLLIASDNVTQAVRRLKYAQNSETRKTISLTQNKIQSIEQRLFLLSEELNLLREEIDNGQYDIPGQDDA